MAEVIDRATFLVSLNNFFGEISGGRHTGWLLLPIPQTDALAGLAAFVAVLLAFPGAVTDRAEGMFRVSEHLAE